MKHPFGSLRSACPLSDRYRVVLLEYEHMETRSKLNNIRRKCLEGQYRQVAIENALSIAIIFPAVPRSFWVRIYLFIFISMYPSDNFYLCF